MANVIAPIKNGRGGSLISIRKGGQLSVVLVCTFCIFTPAGWRLIPIVVPTRTWTVCIVMPAGWHAQIVGRPCANANRSKQSLLQKSEEIGIAFENMTKQSINAGNKFARCTV